MIKSLAGASLVLRNGTTDEVPVPGWKHITYMDWQLTNVLFDFDPRAETTEAGTADETDANLLVSVSNIHGVVLLNSASSHLSSPLRQNSVCRFPGQITTVVRYPTTRKTTSLVAKHLRIRL
jgi:hypothetical protein